MARPFYLAPSTTPLINFYISWLLELLNLHAKREEEQRQTTSSKIAIL